MKLPKPEDLNVPDGVYTCRLTEYRVPWRVRVLGDEIELLDMDEDAYQAMERPRPDDLRAWVWLAKEAVG